MKKTVLIIAGVAFALAPLLAAADGTGDNGGQPPQPGYGRGGYGQGPQGMGGHQPRNFDEVKARIQQRISEREAQLSKIAACVDSATDFQSLRACRPQHRRGPRRGGSRMGGQNQGGSGGPGG